MSVTITVRWAGASDAASGSTYKIERSLDWSVWSELAAAQAATVPYAAVTGTLAGNQDYGDTTIDLVNAASVGSTGYGFIDDALVAWTGKTSNQLTGVTWHSGAGTYASGTTFYVAHESYADSCTPSNLAVVYRITHTDPAGLAGPPAYAWYYYPSAPASRDHCVVLVSVAEDLGYAPRADVTVTCRLKTDSQFADGAGAQQLDQATAATYSQVTNALGLIEFQCWQNGARRGVGGGADAAYEFVLDSSGNALTVTVTTIPDQSWVLLRDIADA